MLVEVAGPTRPLHDTEIRSSDPVDNGLAWFGTQKSTQMKEQS